MNAIHLCLVNVFVTSPSFLSLLAKADAREKEGIKESRENTGEEKEKKRARD